MLQPRQDRPLARQALGLTHDRPTRHAAASAPRAAASRRRRAAPPTPHPCRLRPAAAPAATDRSGRRPARDACAAMAAEASCTTGCSVWLVPSKPVAPTLVSSSASSGFRSLADSGSAASQVARSESSSSSAVASNSLRRCQSSSGQCATRDHARGRNSPSPQRRISVRKTGQTAVSVSAKPTAAAGRAPSRAARCVR